MSNAITSRTTPLASKTMPVSLCSSPSHANQPSRRAGQTHMAKTMLEEDPKVSPATTGAWRRASGSLHPPLCISPALGTRMGPNLGMGFCLSLPSGSTERVEQLRHPMGYTPDCIPHPSLQARRGPKPSRELVGREALLCRMTGANPLRRCPSSSPPWQGSWN